MWENHVPSPMGFVRGDDQDTRMGASINRGKANVRQLLRSLLALAGTLHRPCEGGASSAQVKTREEEEDLAKILLRLSSFKGQQSGDDYLNAFEEVWQAGIAKGYLFNSEVHYLLEGARVLGVAAVFIDALIETENAGVKDRIA